MVVCDCVSPQEEGLWRILVLRGMQLRDLQLGKWQRIKQNHVGVGTGQQQDLRWIEGSGWCG